MQVLKFFGVMAELWSPGPLIVVSSLKGPLLLETTLFSNIKHLDIVFSLFYSNITL